MSDGADSEYAGLAAPNDILNGKPNLSLADSVHYKGGIPNAVSPLIAGMRTGRSDGIPDLTAFDLTLYDRMDPSIQVVWLDENLGTPVPSGMATHRIVPVDVYDSSEIPCSASVELPHELNILWIDAVAADGNPIEPEGTPYFTQKTENFCVPDTRLPALEASSFVTYYLDEYKDHNLDKPESAGLAFTLAWNVDFDDEDPFVFATFSQTILLGHERGMFRQ